MDDKDLARAVAAELGGDVAADTELALTTEKTRSFGVVEAMSIGSFLVNSAQLAMAIWQTPGTGPCWSRRCWRRRQRASCWTQNGVWA